LIQLALAGKAATKVTHGVKTIKAYGLGTTVYLDRPLNEGHKILIAAATTDREIEGLKGDISALIAIVRAANGAAKERRMAEVILPLIGAGHGSICPGFALLVQLLAWSELFYATPGQKLSVRIVVFRAYPTAMPEIDLKSAARLLAVATNVCAPRPRLQ
jgi:hypothetical protein